MFGGMGLVSRCRHSKPISLAWEDVTLHTVKANAIALWLMRDCSGHHFLVQNFVQSKTSDSLDVIWGLFPCTTVVVARRGSWFEAMRAHATAKPG